MTKFVANRVVIPTTGTTAFPQPLRSGATFAAAFAAELENRQFPDDQSFDVDWTVHVLSFCALYSMSALSHTRRMPLHEPHFTGTSFDATF